MTRFFTGSYSMKADEKNRFPVPAPMRKVIKPDETLYYMVGAREVIVIPESKFMNILEGNSLLSPMMFLSTQLDKHGRMLLKGGIIRDKKDVRVLGMINYFIISR